MRFFCKLFHKKNSTKQLKNLSNPLQINIITSTVASFPGSLGVSIFQKALQNGIFKINLIDLKKFAPKNNRIDDYPFGGGAGLVIKPEVLQNALNYGLQKYCDKSIIQKPIIIIPSAKGKLFSNNIAKNLALNLQQNRSIFFVSGRFEGVDQRFIDKNNIIELSVGNFIVAGGDAPIMTMCEAILRFVPQILGNNETHFNESYQMNLDFNIDESKISQMLDEALQNLLLKDFIDKNFDRNLLLKNLLQHLANPLNIVEYSQYTRPAQWSEVKVPQILSSGNHSAISSYRQQEAIKNTILKYLLDNAKNA